MSPLNVKPFKGVIWRERDGERDRRKKERERATMYTEAAQRCCILLEENNLESRIWKTLIY